MWIPEGSLNWWGWMNIPGELVLISCYIVLTSFVFNISLTVSSSSLFNFLFLSSVHIIFGLWSLTSLSFNVIFLLLHSPFPFLSFFFCWLFTFFPLPYIFLFLFPYSSLILLFFPNSFTFPIPFFFFSLLPLPFSFPFSHLLSSPFHSLVFPYSVSYLFLFSCSFVSFFPSLSIPYLSLFFHSRSFCGSSFSSTFSLTSNPPPPPPLLLGIQECAPQREPLRGAPSLSP